MKEKVKSTFLMTFLSVSLGGYSLKPDIWQYLGGKCLAKTNEPTTPTHTHTHKKKNNHATPHESSIIFKTAVIGHVGEREESHVARCV